MNQSVCLKLLGGRTGSHVVFIRCGHRCFPPMKAGVPSSGKGAKHNPCTHEKETQHLRLPQNKPCTHESKTQFVHKRKAQPVLHMGNTPRAHMRTNHELCAQQLTTRAHKKSAIHNSCTQEKHKSCTHEKHPCIVPWGANSQ